MHPGAHPPPALRPPHPREEALLLPAVSTPRPPTTAPSVPRAPSSPVWVNHGGRRHRAHSRSGSDAALVAEPAAAASARLLQAFHAASTPHSAAGASTARVVPLHGLSNWPSASRHSRGTAKDWASDGARPPLVHEVDAYIRRELFHLGRSAATVFDRIPVIAEAFNTVIEHFCEYRDLLAIIKREYDLAVAEGLAAVREIQRLRTDAASQKQSYLFMIESEKSEMEAVVRQAEQRVQQQLSECKKHERAANAENCKRVEAEEAYNIARREADELEQRCKLLSDTLLNENLRQSLLVQQGKKLKADNERLQKMCEAYENRLQSEPMLSDGPASPGSPAAGTIGRSASTTSSKGATLRSVARMASLAATKSVASEEAVEVATELRGRIARLQQLIIAERDKCRGLTETAARLREQRDEEEHRMRHAMATREKLLEERAEQRRQRRDRQRIEDGERREALASWIVEVRENIEGLLKAVGSGGPVVAAKGKRPKAASKKRATNARERLSEADADAATGTDPLLAPVNALLAQLPSLVAVTTSSEDDAVLGEADEAAIDDKVRSQIPWTPRPEWAQLEKVLPNFQLEGDDVTSGEILEKVKSTIKTEIDEIQVKALSENMRLWLAKENVCDEELPRMSNKHFIGHGTGPHVPIFLRHHGLVRNKGISKGAVEDLLKEFWAKRKAENRVEDQLELEPIQDFYMRWLIEKTGSHMQAITLAYNMMDVCEQSRADPDCGMFLSIMQGRVSEATFHDQLSLVDHLQYIVEQRDKKENCDGGRPGYLHRASFHRVLRKLFPAKSAEDMLKLRFCIVPFLVDRNFVDYKRLFEEDDSGNQTRFIELLREQHLWEINEFVVDVEEAIRRAAVVGNGERINVSAAHNALKELDRQMPNETIDKIIAYGAKVTPEGLAKLGPTHTFPAEEFLQRVRTGQLLKRHTPKDSRLQGATTGKGWNGGEDGASDEEGWPGAGDESDAEEKELARVGRWADDGIDFTDIDRELLDEAQLAVSVAAQVAAGGGPTFVDGPPSEGHRSPGSALSRPSSISSRHNSFKLQRVPSESASSSSSAYHSAGRGSVAADGGGGS